MNLSNNFAFWCSLCDKIFEIELKHIISHHNHHIFNQFRLEIPQPNKNLRPLNPESTIYRTPTSVSASEVPKCRPASKCQVSKSRPCCTSIMTAISYMYCFGLSGQVSYKQDVFWDKRKRISCKECSF